MLLERKKKLEQEKTRLQTLLSIARPALAGLTAVRKHQEVGAVKDLSAPTSPTKAVAQPSSTLGKGNKVLQAKQEERRGVEQMELSSTPTANDTIATTEEGKGSVAMPTDEDKPVFQKPAGQYPSVSSKKPSVNPEAKPRPKKSQPPQEEEEEEDKNVVWTPPANQSGDGRTPLNDRFGY